MVWDGSWGKAMTFGLNLSSDIKNETHTLYNFRVKNIYWDR